MLEGGLLVVVTARILKVGDGKVCIEFAKSGECNSMQFYDEFSKIRDYMDDYNNATY